MPGALDLSHARRLFLAALISGATVWPALSLASETLASESNLLRREMLRGHTDANGNVRPDLWLRGLEQARRLPVAPDLRRVGSGLKASKAVGGGGRWFPIGPTSLRLSQDDTAVTGNGPNAGLIADIAIDPRGTTDQVLYVATQGGVWKTLDGGASWAPLTDAMPSLSVGSVAVDSGVHKLRT